MIPNHKGKEKAREFIPEVEYELPQFSSQNTINGIDLNQDTPEILVCGSNVQRMRNKKKRQEKEKGRLKLEHKMMSVWGEHHDPHVSTHVTGYNNVVTKILLGNLVNRRPHHVRFTDTLLELESILGDDEETDELIDSQSETSSNLVAGVNPKLEASIDQLDALFGNDDDNMETDVETQMIDNDNDNVSINQMNSDENNEVNEVNETNEIDEIDEVNEVNKVNEVDTVNEVNEVNEADKVNEINEAVKVNEVIEADRIDEVFEGFPNEKSANEIPVNVDQINETLPHFEFFIIPDSILEKDDDFVLPENYFVNPSKFTFFNIPEEVYLEESEFVLPEEYFLKSQSKTSNNKFPKTKIANSSKVTTNSASTNIELLNNTNDNNVSIELSENVIVEPSKTIDTQDTLFSTSENIILSKIINNTGLRKVISSKKINTQSFRNENSITNKITNDYFPISENIISSRNINFQPSKIISTKVHNLRSNRQKG
ncbi:2443_t:CDS:1 [Diversispora eburnea]|uniref:2443_t:CDS:1 n=1 Tax=Diversispora eburnea TaxID=1213867 RepID=A0A9N9CA57_9GLOM|nr:2443_t:CDS:1 [Diversispora eburnea]